MVRLLACCLLLASSSSSLLAGTVSLAWDPYPLGTEVTHYRVYYGPRPTAVGGIGQGPYDTEIVVPLCSAGGDGVPMLNCIDRAAPEYLVRDLPNCEDRYFAVKGENQRGLSANYSNEIGGWPRPEIDSVLPDVLVAGEATWVRIAGRNYKDGATVTLNSTEAEVRQVQREDCGAIKAEIVVRADATPDVGVTLEVVNPTRVFGSRVNALSFRLVPIPPDVPALRYCQACPPE